MRFLLLFLVLQLNVYAQIGTGQWRLHVPNKKAIDVVAYDNLVFAAFENGLLEYDNDAEETSLWTDVNGLSDINLTCLGYYPSQKAIYIGYDNGNIDKIVNNTVINIPAIRLAQIQGNKRINKIVTHQGFVYFATSFSIVKIDPVKNEVRETFYPTTSGMAILDVAFRGDSIFALTADRLLRGNINNIALTDPSQWVQDNRLDVLSANTYKDLEVIEDQLYVLFQNSNYGQDTVYTIKDTGLEIVTNEPTSIEISSISTFEDKLVVNIDGSIIFYNSDYSHYREITAFAMGSWISPLNSWTNEGITWIADNSLGLIKVIDDFTMAVIAFEGPPKKDFYSMDWNSGKLAVVGGGLTSIAATFNRSGLYIFEEEEWSLRDDNNMTLWNGQNIWDYLCVAVNPVNPDIIAVGTYSELPVSIMDASTQVVDTFTQFNSTLQVSGFGSSSAMTTSMQYDENGNLWVLNGYTDTPLNVYTSDGTWYAFDCGIAAENKFSKKLVIDYDGNKWISIEGSGVFGYNDNGSISNTSDDKVLNLNTGETTGALPSNSVNALAVDFDNEIWIGTDNGFAVLYNSTESFDATAGNYNAQRIKVEYEGNVEYVLGNTNIVDIEVDGANRKWFGTANSGIILLSADGLEVIHQFTMDNSPLISDNIIDLELDQSTGELFIITDKGLVSYRSDASYEDPEYSDVKVFPNPAHPDFEGPITIQGIRYNSDVKITDVAGNLVYQTTSNGGTATWDGKTLKGEKVTTGVYLIWTAANEGKGRNVGKVLVVH
jgi:hypothetical protein